MTLFKDKALHLEEEIALSEDDLWRFLDYNVSLYRIHKRVFDTVIFVKEPTTLTGINLERLTFKPIIVQCANIDADAMLEELKRDIKSGKSVEVKLMSTGNVILDVAEEYGARRNTEEIVRKMLSDNLDILDIIKYTGIDVDRLREIRESLRSEAV